MIVCFCYLNSPVLGELPSDPENEKKISKRAQRFQSYNENSLRASPSIISTLNSSVSHYNIPDNTFTVKRHHH